MKYYFSILVLTLSFLSGQSLELQYVYKVRNTMLNKTFEFPAKLYTDANSKIYVVKYGIAHQMENQNGGGNFFLVDKGSYDYVLWGKDSSNYIIRDKIEEQEYFFEDRPPALIYEITKEQKSFKNITLTKALTQFRGRQYVIWFDANEKAKNGPWKFSNMPGLAYEIYDTEERFRWELIDKKTIPNIPTIAPPKEGIISYTEYPKLKYAVSPILQQDMERRGIKNFKQPRNHLEIVFEWEE